MKPNLQTIDQPTGQHLIMYNTITTLTPVHVEQLHELYQNAWWSKDRTLADIQKMLMHTDYCLGICEVESERLIAFARVLSDRVYRAIVFDVIVAADYRHQGLGSRLVQAITEHPVLSQVECIQLFCLPEMLPFYQQFGFTQAEQLLLVCQRDRPL